MQISILRNYNAWFRFRVIKSIKKHHPDLFDSASKTITGKLKKLFTNKDSWILVLITVILFFLIAPHVDISFINFLELKFDNAKSIIDQRTTNIAAIISMSLVVVGFLINNLAVKSPTTYKLLFKKSLLYFTIYLTFSIIACFMMISLLRDTVSKFTFTRLVIAANYLALTIPFLIGYLFRKIILFTNEKVISNMLKDELLLEGRNKMKKILVRRHSEEIYPMLFKNYAEKEFSFDNFNFSSLDVVFEYVEKTPIENKSELKDINIWLLRFILWCKQLNTKEIYFSKLILDTEIDKEKDIIWSNHKPNGKFLNWCLRKCVWTSKVNIQEDEDEDEDEYRKEFDNKILQLAEDNKYRNLEITLEAYIELYDLQITNQK